MIGVFLFITKVSRVALTLSLKGVSCRLMSGLGEGVAILEDAGILRKIVVLFP